MAVRPQVWWYGNWTSRSTRMRSSDEGRTGMDGYDISPGAARGVISQARDTWSALHGLENTIEGSGEAAASATKEDKINTAMEHAFTNFLRPFTVLMVQMGDRSFDGADSVINIYDNGDTAMSDNTRKESMGDALAESQKLVDYRSGSSTGGERPEPIDGGYDW